MTREEYENNEALTDHELDLQDVANGRFIDIEHAESVWEILDGIASIENALDIFTMVHSDPIINAKTLDELKDFISKLNNFAQYVTNFCKIEPTQTGSTTK